MPDGRAFLVNRRRGRVYARLDTSQGTPKPLIEDDTFAPAQADWARIERKRQTLANTSYRNVVLLQPAAAGPFVSKSLEPVVRRGRVFPDTSQRNVALLAPVAGTPFVSQQVAAAPRHRQVLADTSADTPKTLFSDATEAFQPPPHFRVSPRRTFADTSYRNAALLQPAAPGTPVVSQETLPLPRRRRTYLDTSSSTPKPLFQDSEFAPAQSEFSFNTRKRRTVNPYNYRNEILLQPAPGNPFVSKELAPRPQRRVFYPDTSSGMPKTLFLDAVRAFANPPTLLTPRVARTRDTSQSSPMALLNYVPPAFTHRIFIINE